MCLSAVTVVDKSEQGSSQNSALRILPATLYILPPFPALCDRPIDTQSFVSLGTNGPPLEATPPL